jgi:hypothetical protein
MTREENVEKTVDAQLSSLAPDWRRGSEHWSPSEVVQLLSRLDETV